MIGLQQNEAEKTTLALILRWQAKDAGGYTRAVMIPSALIFIKVTQQRTLT